MIKRKYVPLRIAQPGMMIDQAIIDRAGRVLIARRTRLEDFHIDALKKMGVTGIYTCEGTEDIKPAEADKTQSLPEPLQKKYDQVKVKDPAKVQISESVRSRVAQGVQYLYQDTQSADFTNASRSITDDLLKAIEDNDAVAVDIGALKVSDEYTFKHSVDVATMSMIVARKYGLDDQQVYEIGIAGLLHDIGKSIDHEVEGSHIQIGADLCKKYKESPLVINAVEAHHGDVEPESLIACIVQAADTISAARPGARRETLETYTNRLKQLEDITNSFKGVDKSFAIQAGREIRIMVVPEQVSDADMVLLARDVAKQIEAELEYPGQIKVSVIRESRAVDYAK